MTVIHRRTMLRAMLGSGAVLPVTSLLPRPAESAPFTFGPGFNLSEASDLLYMCDQIYDRPPNSNTPSVPMPPGFSWSNRFTCPDLPPLDEKWELWQNNSVPSTYAIIIRGTVADSVGSVLEDLISILAMATGSVTIAGITIPYKFAADPQATVHVGFLLGTLLLLKFPLAGILAQLAFLPSGSNIYIAGHSQGAAVALLLRSYLYYATELQNQNFSYKTYAFAQPKPGNDHYDIDFGGLFCNTEFAFRLTNSLDWIPQLPFTLEYTADLNVKIPPLLAGTESSLLTTLSTSQNEALKSIEAKARAYSQSTALALARTQNPAAVEAPFDIPIAKSFYFVGAATEIALIGTPCVPSLCNPNDPNDLFWQHHAATYYTLMNAQLDN